MMQTSFIVVIGSEWCNVKDQGEAQGNYMDETSEPPDGVNKEAQPVLTSTLQCLKSGVLNERGWAFL